jgi:hypothetical protein
MCGICIVFDAVDETILALSPSLLGGVAGDIVLAGVGTFEWVAGGVGNWGTSVGVGYESTEDLRDDFSVGIKVVADGGDGGAPGPNDGMAVGMLLVLGFGCANGPEEGAGKV